MDNLQTEDYKWWLSLLDVYSAQPYEHLAKVFMVRGEEGMSKHILYEAREIEKKASDIVLFTRIWLHMKGYFIGHGYYLQYALFSATGLLLFGAIIIFIAPWGKDPTAKGVERSLRDKKKDESLVKYLTFCAMFSFDRLVPFIQLRQKNQCIELEGIVAFYFVIHQISGYVLATLLAIGLTGLAK
jgi:hypothetical protein